MTASLIALGDRRQYCLDLHRPIPIGRRCYRAAVGTESDCIGLLAKFSPTKVADVILAAERHFCRCGIADMGIMRPNDCLGLWTVKGEQCLQRLEHVAVA